VQIAFTTRHRYTVPVGVVHIFKVVPVVEKLKFVTSDIDLVIRACITWFGDLRFGELILSWPKVSTRVLSAKVRLITYGQVELVLDVQPILVVVVVDVVVESVRHDARSGTTRMQASSRSTTLVVSATFRSQVFSAIAVCGCGARCATRD
jgi:hypothetical protein